MSAGLQYDSTAARRLETIYATPDMVGQRGQVLRFLALKQGEHVLDIGSGPGFLAADMAAAVGPSGRVVGIDTSQSMITMAQERCAGTDYRVHFEQADATKLPFGKSEFDLAVSTQVYEYVDAIESALAEVYRVLRAGGRFLVLDTDWNSIVWNSSDGERMRRILAAWDEHLVDPHLPRTLSAKLRQAGFATRQRAVIPLFDPEYDINTYSYLNIEMIGEFVASHGVSQDEVEAWAADLQRLGEAGCYFFSLNRYLFLAVKPQADN